MPLQTWTSLLNASSTWQTGPGSALANSTTESIISPSGPDFRLPALYAQAGQVYRITAHGQYSAVVTAPTLQIRLRFGGVSGTLMLDSGATTCQTTTNVSWVFEGRIQIKSIGSSATAMCTGMTIGLGTTANSITLLPTAAAANVTWNQQNAQDIVLTGQWSAASVSNTVQVLHYLIEQLD
jgi:hypothetical protein